MLGGLEHLKIETRLIDERFVRVCEKCKKVSNLINRPVVSLLDTRVGGTSAEVVPKCIDLKLPPTTRKES